MASPQTANGYGRLANELAQAIYRFPFSGQELRVVLYVIRHSYGWQRKETAPTTVRRVAEDISSPGEKMPPSTVGWVLKGLSRRGVLIREPSGALRLNKNYDEWLRRGAGTLQLTITPRAARVAGAPPEPVRKLTPAWRPPTLDEVRATCAERKSVVDPERFWHHHEGVGWRKGKTPITDWIAVLAYWERTDRNKAPHAGGTPCPICERPITNKNAVVCENCVKCRKCNTQTARLKIFKRPDGTTTAWCLECAKGR